MRISAVGRGLEDDTYQRRLVTMREDAVTNKIS